MRSLICPGLHTIIVFPWSTDTIESILFCFVSVTVRKKLWMMWIVGSAIIVMIVHLHTGCGGCEGLYEIIVQCPPFPLIPLSPIFCPRSLCFHVLLIIRLSAGLYWITPEAHPWINDVGSETQQTFDKVPSFANIIVMWWISLKSSKARPHEWQTKLNWNFHSGQFSDLGSQAHNTHTNHCWLPGLAANNSIRWNVLSQHDSWRSLKYF